MKGIEIADSIDRDAPLLCDKKKELLENLWLKVQREGGRAEKGASVS
jgi:hypothetical protein